MRIIIIRPKDLPTNYQSHIWKYLGLIIVNINETETTDKDKTVCIICMNDVPELQDLQHVNPSSLINRYKL